MITKMPFIIFGLIGIALAIGLFLFGWIGRRINNYPICRKCKYNLSGIREHSNHCPECGRSIISRWSVRNGERHKRGFSMISAVVLFLLSTSFVGYLVWPNIQNINWNLYKPNWWLVLDTSYDNSDSVDQAVHLLADRYSHDQLSHWQINTLIKRALVAQADPKTIWLPSWGDFVEQSWLKGDLTNTQKQQYTKNAGTIDLIVRENTIASAPQELMIGIHGLRCGPPHPHTPSAVNDGPHFGLSVKIHSMTADGRQMISKNQSWPALFGPNAGSSSSLPHKNFTTLGKHKIIAKLTVVGVINIWQLHFLEKQPAKKADLSPLYEVELSKTITIQPENTEIIKGVPDPNLKSIIASSIRFDNLHLEGKGKSLSVVGTIYIDQAPMPLAFEVFLRSQDGKEWKIAEMANIAGCGMMAPVTGFTGSNANIIFRSSKKIALKDPYINQIWDGEIIIKKVPIATSSVDPVGTYYPPVTLIDDPSLKPALLRSTYIDSLVITEGFVTNSEILHGMILFTNLPLPVAFDIFLRDANGQEWSVGSIAVKPTEEPDQMVGNSIYGIITGFTGDKADIILRTDPKAARNQHDITKIWDGELIIKNVPVKKSEKQ